MPKNENIGRRRDSLANIQAKGTANSNYIAMATDCSVAGSTISFCPHRTLTKITRFGTKYPPAIEKKYQHHYYLLEQNHNENSKK